MSHVLKQSSITVMAGPSLALTKYWGKQNHGVNLPATPSLGLTLDTFQTKANVTHSSEPTQITVDGIAQPLERFRPFLEAVTEKLGLQALQIVSSNNYPTAAGLASSSSGFAALAFAAAALSQVPLSQPELSSLARIGSGSAARAVYGGFTEFPAGDDYAVPLYDETYWPELRVIVCQVDHSPKSVSSRQGMMRVQKTCPYYKEWVQDALALHRDARTALDGRNLEKLGDITRHSYLRMFSTMLAASPPLLYWQPGSMALLQLAQEMRDQGVGVWETMDAGPQVKLLCLAETAQTILSHLAERIPSLTPVVVKIGGGPCLSSSPTV